MITEERKNELNFYIRNGYPIMITSDKNEVTDDMSKYNDDVYTITEMVFENFFTILDYHETEHLVTFKINEDMNLYNGLSTTLLTKGQRIDMHLDERANKNFADKFFPGQDDQI